MNTPHDEALRIAREFVADPDKRAQVKVQLAVNGWSKLADMIDEAVIVSRALLAMSENAAPIYVGIRVGPYKLADVDGKIYCGRECGEGGTFGVEQLLPYIEEFFREHF